MRMGGGIMARRFFDSAIAKFSNDDGLAGLVIAMLISITAFSALSAFLSRHAGPTRDVARVQEINREHRLLFSALLADFNAQAPVELVCPDTDFDGDRDAADDAAQPCNGNGTVTGTLPYRTLGVSRDEAIDPYGRYYTYVVVAAPAVRQQCEVVGGDYTGEVVTSTALELRTATQTVGTGRYVPFAVISHGRNGYGARSPTGTGPTSGAGASEILNAADNASTIISGPFDTASASLFDDTVLAPDADAFENLCAGLTSGGAPNVTVLEDFADNDPDFDSAVFDRGGATPPTQANGRAEFTDAGSYIATIQTIFTTPSARAIYVSALWTPVTAASSFSIATRADLDDKVDASDDFSNGSQNGITFRFDGNVSIRNDGAPLATGGSFTRTAGSQYLIEVYDNGLQAWARVTSIDTPTVTAEVRTSVSGDTTGDQRVAFIAQAGASYVDTVTVGTPMLSLRGFAATNGSDNGTATGDLTVEAWIRPRTLPGDEATLVSQWNQGSAGTSSYRLFMSSSGAISIDLQDFGGTNDVETFPLGITADLNTWVHVAVSYDASDQVLRGYRNGELVSTSSTTLEISGIRGAAFPFAVGADTISMGGNTGLNIFAGDISDVRVWDIAKATQVISACYRYRLSTTSCSSTGLVANWTLDPTVEDGGLASGDALAFLGTAGDLDNDATWTPALALYYRPTSDIVCPGFEAGSYRCDFPDAITNYDVTLPDALAGVYVKAWGAGGGGYEATILANDRAGGGGGYAGGFVANTGAAIRITVGAGGLPGALVTASDGGDSTIRRPTGPTLITASGGEGGSLGDQGDQGSGNTHPQVENGVAANSTADEDGPACIPAGDPCIDVYHSGVSNGRGAAAGLNSGRPGLVIFLW